MNEIDAQLEGLMEELAKTQNDYRQLVDEYNALEKQNQELTDQIAVIKGAKAESNTQFHLTTNRVIKEIHVVFAEGGEE